MFDATLNLLKRFILPRKYLIRDDQSLHHVKPVSVQEKFVIKQIGILYDQLADVVDGINKVFSKQVPDILRLKKTDLLPLKLTDGPSHYFSNDARSNLCLCRSESFRL